MAELARECPGEIKEKKLALADDRFHIAPEQIKKEHVPEQVPGAVVEKSGGDELPAVGGAEASIAQGQILTNKARLVSVEKKLGYENDDIQPDQSQENDPRPLRPAPRGWRGLSAGEAHVPRVSQRKIVVDGVVSYRGVKTRKPPARILNSTGQLPISSPSISTGTLSSLLTRSRVV